MLIQKSVIPLEYPVVVIPITKTKGLNIYLSNLKFTVDIKIKCCMKTSFHTKVLTSD